MIRPRRSAADRGAECSDADGLVLGGDRDARPERTGEHPGHSGVPLDSGHFGPFRGETVQAERREVGDGELSHTVVTERRKHVLHVPYEPSVRPDEQHAHRVDAISEDEHGDSLEADHGLARTRPTLDDQHTLGR